MKGEYYLVNIPLRWVKTNLVEVIKRQVINKDCSCKKKTISDIIDNTHVRFVHTGSLNLFRYIAVMNYETSCKFHAMRKFDISGNKET